MAILTAYPQPTPGYLLGTQNWVAQAAHPYNQRKGTLNVDILATDKQRISGRRSEASYFEYQPFDQGSGETGKYFNRPNQTNSVSWLWTISPSLVNEARATLSLDDVYIPVNTALPDSTGRNSASTTRTCSAARTFPARSRPSMSPISTASPADPTRPIPRAPSGRLPTA